MKGISTILAMILIVIIVVALIGLTYTFAVGLFSTTSGTATSQVTTTTTRLDKQVSFIGTVTCSNYNPPNNWVVQFTIRHNGATYNINDAAQNELTAILDSNVIPDANTKLVGGTTTLGTQLIKPGELKTFNLTYVNTSAFTGAHTLTMSAPAGEMPMQITCR
jgi:FlaG/FlaF family flagellin (archaellin)